MQHPFEPSVAHHPFFQGLEPATIRLICDCAKEACFAAGEVIFHQGDEANRFYLLEKGRVALEVFTPERGVVTIQTLGSGEVLGASWLFPPYLWTYEARASEPTRAIAFNAGCLRGACEEDHDLGYELMKRFAQLLVQRLTAARLQLLDVYANPDADRTAPE
jgi:CRP/FNR family transcriptional regulator, cyclic AMP receptor protein